MVPGSLGYVKILKLRNHIGLFHKLLKHCKDPVIRQQVYIMDILWGWCWGGLAM